MLVANFIGDFLLVSVQ